MINLWLIIGVGVMFCMWKMDKGVFADLIHDIEDGYKTGDSANILCAAFMIFVFILAWPLAILRKW